MPNPLPLWGFMLLPGLYYCPTGDLGSQRVRNTSNPQGRHQMWVIVIAFVWSVPPQGTDA